MYKGVEDVWSISVLLSIRLLIYKGNHTILCIVSAVDLDVIR